MATNQTQAIKVRVEATIPLSYQQLPATPSPKTCSDCLSRGKCVKNESSHLHHAGEALLNLAGGAYTLDQLATALEIIEALLKKHYGVKLKK